MKTLKTILITSISIAIFSAGFLSALPANATQVDSLVVEYWSETENNWLLLQGPIFGETNFLPGQNVTRLVRVTNNSGSNQRIATQPLNITDSNRLGDVLNLVIKEGGTTRYDNALSNFLANGEVYLSDLANGANTQYDFTVSFYSGTQNTFQGKSLGFDILIGFQGTEGGILPGAGSSSGGGGGGGGGGLPPGLTIQNEATASTTEISVTITWTTSYPASSQVIYALGSESHTLCLTQTEGCALGTPPKYGYARTTPEYDISPKVTNHSVTIGGLTSGTIYYYRAVSHGSLAISSERSFTTLNTLSGAPSVSAAITLPSVGVSAAPSAPAAETPVAPEQPAEQSVEQPVAQTATQNPLAAAIGGFLTLGTDSVWLGILVGLIILAIIAYAVYLLRKRKDLGKDIK